MTLRKFTLLLVLFGLVLPLTAQQTAVYTDANRFYKQGVDLFEKGVYGKAKQEFEQVIQLLEPVNEPQAELLRTKAEFHRAKSAIMLNQPNGEVLIKEFIRKYHPSPYTDQAIFEMANYYFDERDYDKALTYYEQIPTTGMSRDKRAEINFKTGYSHFVNKDFGKAEDNFEEAADFKGEYYYPSNYYLGLCYFFEGDYSDAIRTLRIAENDASYRSHIPYYLTQIYFAEQRFDEVITYAEPRLSDRRLRNQEEIHQLIGQAYFEKGMYREALPHLQEYAQKSSKLREEEFYQLGYAQYQAREFEQAVESFKPLSNVNSGIGQSAMFYLADCYLKLGQKQEALNALAEAKRMNYDPSLTEEALFNYGKLAFELNQSKAAVNALRELPADSRFYLQAQNLIGEIVLSYRDYEEAMQVLESIPNKNPQVMEAYQKVTAYRGIQLMQADLLDQAGQHFGKSLEFPFDQRIQAIAIYWLGEIAHRQGNYQRSVDLVNRFLTMAKTMNNLPDESSIMTGNYLQGYNYFKQEDYITALRFFAETVDGIQRNRRFIRNENILTDVLGDATLRAGDCHFKRNQYAQAVNYYDRAINSRYPGFVYAIYQKGIIEGLRGRNTDKILALERIAEEFPRSEFADDALLQLASTYQEIGKLRQASQPLEKLVQEYRTSSDLINEAYLKLGLINYNQGDLTAATNYYKQVFGNNPKPDEAKRALAALEEIYVKDLGRPDEYFAFLETIPGYKVDNFARDSINFQAALTKFESGDYQRAIEAYTNYIRNFPNGQYLLQAFYQRGESYAVQRQYSEALRDYQQVIRQGPSHDYLRALEKAAIIAYNHEQDFQAAYQYYSQLENAATSEDIRFEAQLGALRSAYRTGNTQAVYSLANKVANNPNANGQQKSSAYFYLGKVAFDQRDYDNALTAFNQVIQLSDNEQTAEARYLKAYIYYQRRNLDTAQEIALNANKESSAYPYWVAKSVILLSDILAEKGDLYNARAALEALLENYDGDAQLIAEARTKLQRLNQQIMNSSRLNLNPESERMEFSNENQNNEG
jgi:tetratricopeptide (TPR) repeat protein